ncbi:S-formylglutathione hydrolase FrmB [Paenibacillus eucommiae]|uniref:S-formylglutathione hydrolase FrmB n=2 Tax=Paenibacillus eucommiae TaxID=1355755 RepID=A0ABS4J8K3_9BACL|nr:S-formylglutathione hydrolase FrmB [Paenibacillus eucommiae]
MSVILPQQTLTQIGMSSQRKEQKLHPTLFLLHGFSDDETTWVRRTSIERYAANLGLAIVMPNVHHSFYSDMVYGNRYWTFLSEELPAIARSFFPLSDDREDNFVAGLSMGGYGAFKWALRHPERFAAAASLSGALDMVSFIKGQANEGAFKRVFELIYGDADITGTEDDLLWLLKRGDYSKELAPKFYQCCGTDDFLYQDNLSFRDASKQTGLDLLYDEGPGNHSWDYWDAKIQDVLKWLPIR